MDPASIRATGREAARLTWNRRSVLGGVLAGEYTGSIPVNSSAKFPTSSSLFSSGLKGLCTFLCARSAQFSPCEEAQGELWMDEKEATGEGDVKKTGSRGP